MMLGAVLVMAGTSCSDNDEYDNPSRPVEPGDSYFSSEPVEEGPSLFDAATINTSKIPRVTSNKNTGLDEYYPLDPGDTWASELLTPEQMEMYQVYRQTMGNKPLLFGGGSPDTSGSEDLSGVQFINGTRPGNPQLVELAKRQVGNVGGYPYWSWYGFDSRVE